MRQWVRKFNEITLLIILTFLYFPVVGMTYLLFKLFHREKKTAGTYWIKADDKPADFKSPY